MEFHEKGIIAFFYNCIHLLKRDFLQQVPHCDSIFSRNVVIFRERGNLQMNHTVTPYIRSVGDTCRQWLQNPRNFLVLRCFGYFLLGFTASAGSLASYFQPVALALVCALSGWGSFLAAMGGCAGYLLLWGGPGWQGVAWVLSGLVSITFFGENRIFRQTPMLLPALAGLITAGWGVVFQTFMGDSAPVSMYLLRVLLAFGACRVLMQVVRGRDPVCQWITWGLSCLCLAQLSPVLWLNPGYILAGALCVAGAFPAAALAGLGLDLAGITAVPMTAVLCGGFLVRFLPRLPRQVAWLAPAAAALVVMQMGCGQDFYMLPGLLAGGAVGVLLPLHGRLQYRRGETGVAQVRLEMAAGVLAQTEQLLLEVPPPPVDEDALVRRAAEAACAGCPCRHSCKDSRRIAQLPGPVLHKPLLATQEIPVQCRRSGRFLAELHRSQEQLRSIRADRERQKEYKSAVVQQYRFLADFLRQTADQLPRRAEAVRFSFRPRIQFFGNRPGEENGDRCLSFAGVGCRHYVLLCDGMGTGPGAVQEGKHAAALLKRLLLAGYPAKHALGSLNSLCALRQRAASVTVDLAELLLDSGKVNLYKWGAPCSWLVTELAVERLGMTGPPPGISVTEYRGTAEQFSLRRGELLVMVSDGIDQAQMPSCCRALGNSKAPSDLAKTLLSCCQDDSGDDATIALVRLETL